MITKIAQSIKKGPPKAETPEQLLHQIKNYIPQDQPEVEGRTTLQEKTTGNIQTTPVFSANQEDSGEYKHTHLRRYQLKTRSGKLTIQWETSNYSRRKYLLKNNPPPKPLDAIQIKQEGGIIWEITNMNMTTSSACNDRLSTTCNTWRPTREKSPKTMQSISKYAAFYGISLIRPTLTYALHTKGLTARGIRQLDMFMFKRIKQITEPNRFRQNKHSRPSSALPET